jgi:hypothetical protein
VGHAAYATIRHERLEQPGLRSHDPNFTVCDLDVLREHTKMVAAVASPFKQDVLARGTGKPCSTGAAWSWSSQWRNTNG